MNFLFVLSSKFKQNLNGFFRVNNYNLKSPSESGWKSYFSLKLCYFSTGISDQWVALGTVSRLSDLLSLPDLFKFLWTVDTNLCLFFP